MEKQNYLANLQQFEGMSLRGIAKKSGHHFNTVKKYVDREDWNESNKPRKERGTELEPLIPVIDLSANLLHNILRSVFRDFFVEKFHYKQIMLKFFRKISRKTSSQSAAQ
jgi:phage-related protein